MTIHLVTFSDSQMSHSAKLCVESAKKQGVGTAEIYGSLEQTTERGCGFWRWKPEIILRGMCGTDSRLIEGDILIYADAGVEFIENVNYIIDRMDQDTFLFGNQWEHAHWCKRNVIEVIWPIRGVSDRDRDLREKLNWKRFGKQCQASVIFFRVSDYSRQFVAEWLKWCLWNNGELIDDSPSWYVNHPEFQEHRHDQAILTTMAYREGIKLHAWPASYNDGAFQYPREGYEGDDYPCLFNHHRRRNADWEQAA